jgi:hypothetical protein
MKPFSGWVRSGARNDKLIDKRRGGLLAEKVPRRTRSLLPYPNTELVMSVVFIRGSRRLSRLNAVIRGRLDNIIERNHAALIGDANGGDLAVQAYLAERGYSPITVYCTNAHYRNNVGQWPVQSVAATDQRGFDYYALKDAAMAADAE